MIIRLHFTLRTALLLIIVLKPAALFADSFPSPGIRSGISLLGIPIRLEETPDGSEIDKRVSVIVDGPRSLRVKPGTGKWETRWFRVETGRYQFISNEGAATGEFVDVARDEVIISPRRVVFFFTPEGETTYRIESTDEQDRQQAALDLASYVDFPEWQGKKFVGFGTIRPNVDVADTLFETRITSAPADSEVYLDDRLAGTTPITLTIPGGKHKLLFRAEGYQDETRYVRLEGDANIAVQLNAAINEKTGGRETYRTVVGGFLPRGEGNEQINRLFQDTLEIALDEDPRLSIVRSDINWVDVGDLARPDFTVLEESGADLAVSGTFFKEGSNLVVQANLYDIQGETVKSGTFWTGDVGLDIFDAMDLIAEKFVSEVDRVLPDAGRVLVTQTETVYGALSDREQRVTRKQLIDKRRRDYPDALSGHIGIQGIMEYGVSRMSGMPYLTATFDWTRDLSNLWQTGAGMNFGIQADRSFTGATAFPFTDMEAYGAGRIMFRSLRSDMSFGATLNLRFTPQFDDSGTMVGPFLSLAMPFEFRLKYYFTDSITRPPVFFLANISFGFYGIRLDIGGGGHHGFVSLSGLLTLGMGAHL